MYIFKNKNIEREGKATPPYRSSVGDEIEKKKIHKAPFARWCIYSNAALVRAYMASPHVQAQCSNLRGIVENTAVFLPMYDWHKCIELCISVHLIAVHITIVFNPLSL